MQCTTSFPKSHRCSKPTLVKGGRRGFSHLLLFIIPRAQCASCSASATQPFLFKATLEARTTSWPLLSSCQRKAGKQGRAEVAGKGGCLQAEGSQSSQQRPWGHGDSTAVAALQLFPARCSLRVMPLPPNPALPAETRPQGAMGAAGGMAQWLGRVTGSQPGWLLGEGDILLWAMRTKGNN